MPLPLNPNLDWLRKQAKRQLDEQGDEMDEAIWGSLLLAGDRLYVGNVEGSMTVLRAGRRKELLAQIEMDAPLYSRPALIGDALYLATARRLHLIAAKP